MSGLDDLVAEAQRQLTVCNACRYCEGYCAVFPALERRTLLEGGDITQIANLCHDCRACFHACMYTAPHEFAINVPAILSTVRLQSYEEQVPRIRSRRLPALVNPWVVTGLTAVVMALLVAASSGIEALWRAGGHGSPYDVISYPTLLVTVVAPLVFSLAIALRAVVRYWADIAPRRGDFFDARAHGAALRLALTLHYQRGGGDECYYPTSRPNPARRRLHSLLVFGFACCSASTAAAGILQHFMAVDPPYPYLSAPVLLGLVGGSSMIVGCTGLTILKARSDSEPSDERMQARDYGLLTALNALAATGMLTLFTRTTPAFTLVLITHLAAIVVAFGIFPYTKFMHWVYRYLSIVKDCRERQSAS